MALETGQILNGRYRIVKKLAEGGYGAVYRAWDLNLNMPCALKENLASYAVNIEQFSQEAKVLANLHHPHLPRVTDYFIIPDQGQYLVMDYIEGEDLQQLIERAGGPLPVEAVLGWIEQVGDALMYLHAFNPPIIHRDIKPANIKITPAGKAMLVDFGISKLAVPGAQTSAGARAVTPGFSPPEQYGQGLTDVTSDVYSLGATLYACLTGKAPPDAADVLSGLSKSIPPISALNPMVTIELSAVISKAMRMNKDDRFSSMAEFMEALGRAKPAAVVGVVSSGVQPVPAAVSAAAAEEQQPEPVLIQPVRSIAAAAEEVKPPPVNSSFAVPSAPPPGAAEEKKTNWGLILGIGVGLLVLAVLCIAGLWFGYQAYTAANLEKTVQAVSALITSSPAGATAAPPTATASLPTLTPTITPTLPPTETPTPALGVGSTMVAETDGMTLVYVPEGEFLMGAGPEERYALPSEKPQHTVYLDAFWIDQTEVTNAMYAKCVKAGGCAPPKRTVNADRTDYYNNPAKANYPMIYVTWQEAQNYCSWAGRRLPTEAEWEKAARGEDGRPYPWGSDQPTCQLANTWAWNYYDSWNDKVGVQKGCSDGPVAVGSFPIGASPYGVLDMIGNVGEWVADYYSGTYYGESPERNPQGPASGETRVIRGLMGYFQQTDVLWIRYGNRLFNFGDFFFRQSVWVRFFNTENYRFYDLGFRCAKNP